MVDGFGDGIPAFERLADSSQSEVVTGVQRNLRRWSRWLTSGVAPPDADFDPLREWARARASEGVRLEDLLRAFAIGRQVGWELLRRHAREDETEALLDAAGLLMQYVDRVSAIVTDTYLAERDALVSEEERRTRNLIERLSSGEPLDAQDLELAERLRVPVEVDYAPFMIVMPERPPRRHAALAARLRRRGWKLAVTEGGRVTGLAHKPIAVVDLDEGPNVVLALTNPVSRSELAEARKEVSLLAEHGLRHGLRGAIRVADHLPEVLMGRRPATAAALRERILAPLSDHTHDELLQTLRCFVAHDFDRAATCGELHIHRNTLAYRLRRIEEITELRLDSARDLACVYLALGIEAPGEVEP